MKTRAMLVFCLIMISACGNAQDPSAGQPAAIEAASPVLAAQGDSPAPIPCPKSATPNGQHVDQTLTYEIGNKGKVYTILQRKHLASDPGLHVFQDTYFVKDVAISERLTSEWFGLFVVSTRHGNEQYRLEIKDLQPELFGRLLGEQRMDLNGRFQSDLGKENAEGKSKIQILLRGCKPGNSGGIIHMFQVKQEEGGEKSESIVEYDVLRDLVIRSQDTKSGNFMQIAE